MIRVLKWPGSKGWLASSLNSAIPAFDRILEPFCGGASFFLNRPESNGFLADCNPDLIMTLSSVKNSIQDLIELLETTSNTLGDFQLLRDLDFGTNSVAIAARLIFLTNTSWGGLYRENRKGEFNVPFGNNGRPTFDKADLLLASRRLAACDLACMDFRKALSFARHSDLIFVDPPYFSTEKVERFIRYGHQPFSMQDTRDLIEKLNQLGDDGHNIVYCGRSDSPWNLDLKGWRPSRVYRRNHLTSRLSNPSVREEAVFFSPNLTLKIFQ